MTTDLYAIQRGMRNMRQAAMQRGVVAILDVGTSKVACLVLRFEGPDHLGEPDGLGSDGGQSRFRVIGAATTRSRGVRFGEIEAMNETERAIRTAVQAAQKMANVRVDHVIACIAGAEPRSYGLAGNIELHDSVVSEEDVARSLAACDVPDIGDGREVLHAHPVNFALDHRSGMNDPRGQIGNTLAVDMHLLTVETTAVQNLVYCIKRCDLELAGLASSSYVAGLSALVEDEQELGGACIDLGGGATGVSIFIKKAHDIRRFRAHGRRSCHRRYRQGPAGADGDAERIKTFYGGVMATGMDDREMIEIGGDTGDWEHDRRTVSRSELIGIMRPRVEEILEETRARLDAAGFDHLPSQQIVLTGGGSQIPGLDGLATKILGHQVRLGRPLRVQGLPQAATGQRSPRRSGSASLRRTRRTNGGTSTSPPEGYPARSLRRAMKWFKDNW